MAQKVNRVHIAVLGAFLKKCKLLQMVPAGDPKWAAILRAQAFRPSADLNESNRASFMEVQNKTTHHPILKSKTTSHSFSHCRGRFSFLFPIEKWQKGLPSSAVKVETRQPLGFKDTGKESSSVRK